MPEKNPRFTTTHWSIVRLASQDDQESSKEALETLCRTYWYPLFAFVRRDGCSESEAEDLVQGFFARFLERKDFAKASQEKGRLRSYLLGALKNYLANEWQRSQAQKRGTRENTIALDGLPGEERIKFEPAESKTPDLAFEQSWAMTVLNRPFEVLRTEYSAAGNHRIYEVFRSLLGDSEAPLQEVAKELGMTENSVKQAFFRFRQKYRTLLRNEIAQTVVSPGEIEEEMRYLVTILRK